MSRRDVYVGIMALVEEVQKYALSAPLKQLQMQTEYLKKNHINYTEEEQRQLKYSLEVANFKHYLLSMSLENIWSISENTKSGVMDALENSVDRLVITDTELIASSFLLENVLLQGVAFLDIYMLYLLQILKTGYSGSITTYDRFFKHLELVPLEFKEKAAKVKEYFKSRVVGQGVKGQMDTVFPNNWGSILRSLRDKVAHRDRIRPVFESKETLISDILFDWPTLQGLTYDRFAQSLENGMFNMIYSLSKHLYDLDWYAGPYNPDFEFAND